MAAFRGRASRVALAVLAGALSLAPAACRRGPRPAHVASVRVVGGSVSDTLRDAGLDTPTLEAAALSALQAAGFRAGAGERTYRARVEVVGVRLAPPDGASSGPRVEVGVEIALEPESETDLPVLRDIGSGVAAVAEGGPAGAFRQAVGAAARDAAEGLALGLAAEGKPLRQVLADLGSPDPRVRDHAVRALAERRNPDTVPALVQRLDDADADVVQRAVGALAQIGDPRAVPSLIELAQRADPDLAARVVRVIGDLGGPEAEGYLLTVESGHSDRRVRRAARDALRDLRAHAGGTAMNRDR